MEYGIAKPSDKFLVPIELDSNTWVSEVKRIRGKKQPLTAAGLHALWDEYTRTIEGEGRRKNAECRNPGRNHPSVAKRPAPHAHSGTRNMISPQVRRKHHRKQH
jgi:hypothetical protein